MYGSIEAWISRLLGFIDLTMIFYWSTRSQLHHATVEEDCSISETFGAMLTAMMMIRTNRFLILLSRRDIGRESEPTLGVLGLRCTKRWAKAQLAESVDK